MAIDTFPSPGDDATRAPLAESEENNHGEAEQSSESAILSPEVVERYFYHEEGDPPDERRFSTEYIWRDFFSLKPRDLFKPENLSLLQRISQMDRLDLLTRAIKYLEVDPSLVENYFSLFPDDLNDVIGKYKGQAGQPITNQDIFLFTAVSPLLVKHGIEIERHGLSYLDKNIRWQRAQRLFLKGHAIDGSRVIYEKYDLASKRFQEVFEEACQMENRLGGDHSLNAKKIFQSREYLALSPQDKSELVRACIDQVHKAMLFTEVFDSAFSEQNQGRGMAHSMTFPGHLAGSAFRLFNMAQGVFDRHMGSNAASGGAVEEYPMHKILLVAIQELGSIETDKDENTGFLVDFWDKSRNPVFCNSVAGAISRLSSGAGATRLMSAIRETKRDKAPLTAMLYRLEFGRLGISEEGVQYLERMYDLGELNNPDYFVHRLTSGGDIGIFNENSELINHFNLGDLTSDERNIKAEVLSFTYETLFTARPGETPEERQRREAILQEFKSKYFDFYNGEFFRSTGVAFNNLSFKEQGWFLHFASDATPKQRERLRRFTEDHQEDGLAAFLSLEHGDEMGEIVLRISEIFPPELARRVFLKYREIMSAVDKVSQYLSKEYGEGGEQKDLISKVTRTILSRAKTFLMECANVEPDAELLKIARETIQKSIAAGEVELSDPDAVIERFARGLQVEAIEERLERISGETLLFASTLKAMKAEGVAVELEELGGVEFSITRAGELERQDLHLMRRIYERNYMDSTVPSEFREAILSKFDADISDSKNPPRFYILRHSGQIVAFCSFKLVEYWNKTGYHNYQHFSAVNVDPEYRGSKIGDAMLDQALVSETEYGGEIRAECTATAEIAMNYVERGFVATEELFFKGVHGLNIERDDSHNFKYRGKKMSREEIIRNATIKLDLENMQAGVVCVERDAPGQIPFDKIRPGKNYDIGRVMTRYFRQGGIVYAVFDISIPKQPSAYIV